MEGIGIVEFDKRDIVRHRLVKYIVDAFDKRDAVEISLAKQSPRNEEREEWRVEITVTNL